MEQEFTVLENKTIGKNMYNLMTKLLESQITMTEKIIALLEKK